MCHNLLITKFVPAKKQVALVMPGMKNIWIRDWISVDHEYITLSFSKFMKETKDNYLPQDWENQVCINMIHLYIHTCRFWGVVLGLVPTSPQAQLSAP